MNRRLAWTLGAVAGVVVVTGIAVWWWQSAADEPAPAASVSPSAADSAAPTDAQITRLAQQRLDEHLEACAADAIGAALPDGCGLRIPWGTEFAAVDTVRMRIETMPVLERADDRFLADHGVLVATVSGTGQDGSPRTETYRTDSWSVRGDLEITDSEVELDVW